MVAGTTRQYVYDGLNRVTSALDVTTGTQNPAPGGLGESFSYDAFGNLWESGSFNFWPAQYSAANQPSPGWNYDGAGNLTSDGLKTENLENLGTDGMFPGE